MEQHDIVDELLALRKEVQELKFLAGGGVLSDLASRISKLESKRDIPDMDKLLLDESFGGSSAEPIVKDGNDTRTVNINYDGWLFISCHTSNVLSGSEGSTSTEYVATTLSFVYNSKTIMDSYSNCSHKDSHTTESNAIAIPCTKGSKLVINGTNPNNPQNFVRVRVYGSM